LRTTRAYLAGLGTTGVLLTYLALLLVVVGALVAFKASAGADGIREIEGLTVDRDERAGPGGPAMAAAEAAPTAGGVSPRTPASVVASRPPGGSAPESSSSVATGGISSDAGGPGGSPPGTRSFRPPQPTGGATELPQPTPQVPVGLEVPGSSDPGQARQSLGETTQVITDDLGRVVDSIDPRLGETVQGLGQGVGQLVDGLAGGLTGTR